MRSQSFKQAISKPKAYGREEIPAYWNPNRVGAYQAPSWFMEKLKEVGEELECCWNPVSERWQIFSKAPNLRHPICSGWRLLFIVQDADHNFQPLDERIFARLYAASAMKHGSARKYFDHVIAEMERDKERREQKHYQDTIDLAMPSWEHSQISVAMRGKSNGSKFSTYHA